MRVNMQPVFKGAATLAVALSVAGIGTLSAQAGGKSPPPAYDVTLENVSYDLYGGKVTHPKIDIKGSNLAKADIEKMFVEGTASPDRLKALQGFTAGSVDIPATNFAFEAGTLKVSASCAGSKMEKIAGGKIGKSALANCTGQVVDKDKTIASFSFGAKGGGSNDFNFLHVYRLWTDKAGPDDKDAVALDGPGTAEGVTFAFTGPNITVKGEIGKITQTESSKIKLLSRPLKDVSTQLTKLLAEAKTNPGADGPTSEQIDQIKQVGLTAIEFLENIQPGATTIENYTLTETISDPKLAEPITVNAKIAKMESKGFNSQISDIAFNGGKVTGKIGSLSLKNFSFAPFLAEIKKLLMMPNDQLVAEAGKVSKGQSSLFYRALGSYYANLGTWSLNDLEVNAKGITKAAAKPSDDEEEDEAPANPAPAPAPETVDLTVKLKNFTFKMEKPFNGIPTALRFSFDNLQLPATVFTLDGSKDSLKFYKSLQSVGIDTINASHAIDLSWNNNSKEFLINEIKAAEESLGSVSLKGTIGNFGETMFSWDPKAIQMAAIGLTAKDVSLHSEDKGGLDKILKLVAAEKGGSPEQIKAIVPLMAAMIPERLANLTSVQTLKSALLAYWEKPGMLDIAIKSKTGAGLGLADFMAASQDPTTLDAKVDVTATAK